MKAWKLWVGSVTVYVAVAACSATAEHLGQRSGAAAPDAGLLAEAAAILDAAIEGVLKPTTDAKAAPSVVTAQCGTLESTSGTVISMWAEHLVPGKTATELSATVALLTPQSGAPPGYSSHTTLVWLRDGGVAAYCGARTTDGGVMIPPSPVTFILP